MVQAVLLTVMVMTIGLLAVISRVASSRDSAAASSLSAAARQAADFGFSEIVAEMNHDSKGYLWLTPLASWNSVSDDDLKACGLYSASAPVANPIAGVASSRALPGSTDLSYQLSDYQPPTNLGGTGCGSFGNRKGGTATLTVTGRARHGSGDVTTYTLRRSVSVGPALPEFRKSIFTAANSPPNATTNPRYPHFPTPELLGVSGGGTGTDITCSPGGGGGGGNSVYSCGSESFDNRNTLKFPYTSSGSLASFCRTGSGQVVCTIGSLFLNNVEMIVSVRDVAVNLFINGTLQINSNANLCSDASAGASTTCAAVRTASAGDWRRLRLFGRSSGSACDQTIQLNGASINLSDAFLWFPTASLTYSANTLPAGLVGSICSVPSPTTSPASITPDALLAGLSDPSLSSLPSLRLLAYRGYGSQDLP
mgnify:CR=1 FL=1